MTKGKESRNHNSESGWKRTMAATRLFSNKVTGSHNGILFGEKFCAWDNNDRSMEMVHCQTEAPCPVYHREEISGWEGQEGSTQEKMQKFD